MRPWLEALAEEAVETGQTMAANERTRGEKVATKLKDDLEKTRQQLSAGRLTLVYFSVH